MEKMLIQLLKVFISILLILLLSLFIHLYKSIILKPRNLRLQLQKQGIKGPKPNIFFGNIPEMKKIQSMKNQKKKKKDLIGEESGGGISHDYVSNLFPYFEQWRNEYGLPRFKDRLEKWISSYLDPKGRRPGECFQAKGGSIRMTCYAGWVLKCSMHFHEIHELGPIFTYSTGSMQQVYMSDLGVIKEISLCTSWDFGKPLFLQEDRKALLGQGILTSNGEKWANQRKIIGPEFYMNKVKGMINLMVESATPLLKSWENKIESEGGTGYIRIDEDLRNLSADVISRACFGSSYSKGREIFLKLRDLQHLMSLQGLALGVPGLRYLPTKNNRKIWRLEKEIDLLILKIVKERKESKSEKDLLQMILEAATNEESGLVITDRFIIDNCKNIYFAGFETTAITAIWIMIFLAADPELQSRVRAEVEQVCGGCLPTGDMLRKMKTLTMVIQETLRLYPPAAFVVREALKDIKFGDLHIPEGVKVWIQILKLHQDPKIWGPDVLEFKPDRFANGIAGACTAPHAYLPFGFGPRSCLGQNFAMVELKVILSLVLSRFSFTLSPKYRHSPAYRLVIQPGDDVGLLVKRL